MTCLSHLNVDSSQTFFPFFSVSLCFCQALFYPLPITSFSHFSILFNSLDFSFFISSLLSSSHCFPTLCCFHLLFLLQTPLCLCFSLSVSWQPRPFFSALVSFCVSVCFLFYRWTGATLAVSLSTTLGSSLCHSRWFSKRQRCLSPFIYSTRNASFQFRAQLISIYHHVASQLCFTID